MEQHNNSSSFFYKNIVSQKEDSKEILSSSIYSRRKSLPLYSAKSSSVKHYHIKTRPTSELKLSSKDKLPSYNFSNIKPFLDGEDCPESNYINSSEISLHCKYSGDGYAGSRFHNPPNPNSLPKPPLHWIDSSASINCVLPTAYLDSIAVDLKGLLHMPA